MEANQQRDRITNVAILKGGTVIDLGNPLTINTDLTINGSLHVGFNWSAYQRKLAKEKASKK